MERVLILWLPSLRVEGSRGDELRAFAAAIEIVAVHCPFVEPIRLGVLALPARAPSRFYGGEAAVIDLLTGALRECGLTPVRAGVADGLFAAVLAAREERIIPDGQTRAFLAAQPISVLRRAELASLGQRLGLHTVGRFAALEEARVLERFGTDGAHCHRVARGEEAELVGLRDPELPRRLTLLEEPPAPPVQSGFFGGSSLAAERAARAAIRLQQRFGSSIVAVARSRSGHDPSERAELVPFGAPAEHQRSGAPWPGALPAPSPVAVLGRPLGCRLTDELGCPVTLSAQGLLSGRPARCTIEGEARTLSVVSWAGPWPLAVRWWERRAPCARLQVVTDMGIGLLLCAQRGVWQLLGRYD